MDSSKNKKKTKRISIIYKNKRRKMVETGSLTLRNESSQRVKYFKIFSLLERP